MTRVGIISLEEAKKQKILEEIIATHPGTLKDSKGFLVHSYDSAIIIRDILDRAIYYYPDEFQFRIDSKEIEIAAYLHDVGRPLQKDQLFHELRGAEYIEEEGGRLGIASAKKPDKQLYRIAETIRSHFVVYEQFHMPELEDKKKEFDNIDPDLLIPVTWNQKFVVYAELSNVKGEIMTPQERVEELEYRYSKDPEYKDELFLKAIRNGKERIFRLCNTVDELVKGKMDVKEIKRYGFLM